MCSNIYKYKYMNIQIQICENKDAIYTNRQIEIIVWMQWEETELACWWWLRSWRPTGVLLLLLVLPRHHHTLLLTNTYIQILKYKYENTQLQIYKYSWGPTGVHLLLLVTSHPRRGTITNCCWQIHIQIQTNIYKNIDKYMKIKMYLNKTSWLTNTAHNLI